MGASQSVEVYVQDAVRLLVWRHAGSPRVKTISLAVDNRPLPKPYLGTAVSDAVAVFVALAEGPAPIAPLQVSIEDEAGTSLFRSDRAPVRPLTELPEGLADSDACSRLLTRVLRHAPQILAGWTDHLTAALASLRPGIERSRSIPDTAQAIVMGAVERIEGGKILGWALDPRRPFLALEVGVYRDGQRIATLKADRYRPELKTGQAVSAHHGFELDTSILAGGEGSSLWDLRVVGSAKPLKGSPFRVVSGELAQEPSDPGARGRIPVSRSTTSAGSALKGAVDLVDGRRVTGWALDCSDPVKVLRLQLEVNGVPAATTVADELRDDLDLPEGASHHGFHALLRKDVLSSPWRELHRLSVRDLDSGSLLVEGYPIRYRRDQEERESAGFARRIQRLEQTLLELREQLPYLRRRTAYSLSDYDLWHEEVHRTATRYDSPGSKEPRSDARFPSIGIVAFLTHECTLAGFRRVLDSLVTQPPGRHRCVVVNRSQTDQVYELLAQTYLGRIPDLLWIDARGEPIPSVLRTALHLTDTDGMLLLRPGEGLAVDGLTWFAKGLAQTPALLLYADGDRLDENGVHRDPELRPDFNPDLLLSHPYIGSFCIRRTLLESLAEEVADQSDEVWQMDLVLRATERTEPKDWLHIARVLTHRALPVPRPQGNDDALARPLAVLRGHLERRRAPCEAGIDETLYQANPEIPRSPGTFAARLRWRVPNPAPKVSIVIPTRNGEDLVRTCIESILKGTDYPDYEILLVDHDSSDADALRYFKQLDGQPGIRVLRYSGAFNWSAINNFAAARATGAALCFLNNDTEVISADWLQELVGHACRPGTGAVGAKLLFADGTLQHGGVVLGAHGIAEHAFTGLAADKSGYGMRARLAQNLSAVTGACLLCMKEIFDRVGGFDAVHLPIAYNDVDFCLRLSEVGYRTVWTPYACLYHYGSSTLGRGADEEARARIERETSYMLMRWGRLLERDPYYNPAFERHDHPYTALTCTPLSPIPASWDSYEHRAEPRRERGA